MYVVEQKPKGLQMVYNKSLGTGLFLSCLYFYLPEASLFSLCSSSLREGWVPEILALTVETGRKMVEVGCNQGGGGALPDVQIYALVSQSRNQPFTIRLIPPPPLEPARNAPQLPAYSRNLFIFLFTLFTL